MGANPITDLDLEAFCRRKLMELSSWEKDLIFRIDDAVLGASAKSDPKTSEPAEIPVTDVKSVKGFFRGLGSKNTTKP